MCGIAGGLALHQGSPLTREELARMVGTLRHRGPDGFGFLQAGPVGFAHARLSIIDLSTGDQPIANEDKTIWVILNGEIFNYVELRAELASLGHHFHTQSDTETIVHAYEEYGEGFVSRLNGQFAIALWDAPHQRLLLARDRVGIRPLFYVEDAGRLLFASEIKALRPVMHRALELDPLGLAQVFTFWSALETQTAFQSVVSLPPGHLLVAEGGTSRLHRYWDWQFPPEQIDRRISFDEAAEGLRALLVDAVRLQLRADVPVGAYLSGGLDSSGIVALIRQSRSMSLRTFSVAFDDPEFDESEHQQAMVRHLGTDHSVFHCSRRMIGEHFPRLIAHTETPVVRTAPVPLMLLSGLVHESGFKVVLTGEGADEVLGGYDLFKEAKIRRFWARQPASASRPALLGRLYPYLRHSPVGNAAYAKSFYGQGLKEITQPHFAHLPRWTTTQRLWKFFSADVRAALREQNGCRWAAELAPTQFKHWNSLARDQYMEAHTLLSSYLLSSQGDRVAMANSVEGRVPFLDHRVIEYAAKLPEHYKIRGLTEKAVLRHALRDLLPGEIIKRVKQPYRAPDTQSFFEHGRELDYVANLLSAERVEESGYFDVPAVSRLLDKCRAGRAIGFADNMAFVGILSTMLLDETMIRGRSV